MASEDHNSNEPRMMTIGAVVRELTRDYPEVSHSSLRFLEREGFITSTRTKGGHRLYSPEQVQKIRQIKAWQADRLSLGDIRAQFDRLGNLPTSADLSSQFLELALHGNLRGASDLILEADDFGMPILASFEDIIHPALTELGRRWASGQISVSQEKEVSEMTRDLVAELALRHARYDADGPRVVAAGVKGELHVIGLRMICGLLDAEGYFVYYLGANVDPRFLLEAVERQQPDVVLLSAVIADNFPAMVETVKELSGKSVDGCPIPIVTGGYAAHQRADELVALGATPVRTEHLADALEVIRSVTAP